MALPRGDLLDPVESSFAPRLRERVVEVAARHGLDLAVLFGSRATGRAHPGSDLDLAVAGPAALNWRTLLDLTADLQEPIHGIRVDVADLSRADPLFLREIFQTAVCLFEKPGAFAAARLRAFHAYEDYRPFLRLERDCVRRALGIS